MNARSSDARWIWQVDIATVRGMEIAMKLDKDRALLATSQQASSDARVNAAEKAETAKV